MLTCKDLRVQSQPLRGFENRNLELKKGSAPFDDPLFNF